MTRPRSSARQSRTSVADDRIMDMWDKGMTIRTIAQELGVSDTRIRTVIASMSVSPADRWQEPVIQGSRALARRIREVHGIRS
jgi:hypothetical protein